MSYEDKEPEEDPSESELERINERINDLFKFRWFGPDELMSPAPQTIKINSLVLEFCGTSHRYAVGEAGVVKITMVSLNDDNWVRVVYQDEKEKTLMNPDKIIAMTVAL